MKGSLPLSSLHLTSASTVKEAAPASGASRTGASRRYTSTSTCTTGRGVCRCVIIAAERSILRSGCLGAGVKGGGRFADLRDALGERLEAMAPRLTLVVGRVIVVVFRVALVLVVLLSVPFAGGRHLWPTSGR